MRHVELHGTVAAGGHGGAGGDQRAVELELRLVGAVVGDAQALAVDGVGGVGGVDAGVADAQRGLVAGRDVSPLGQRGAGVLVGQRGLAQVAADVRVDGHAANRVVQRAGRLVRAQPARQVARVAGEVAADVGAVGILDVVGRAGGPAGGRAQVAGGVVAGGRGQVDANLARVRLVAGVEVVVRAADVDLDPDVVDLQADERGARSRATARGSGDDAGDRDAAVAQQVQHGTDFGGVHTQPVGDLRGRQVDAALDVVGGVAGLAQQLDHQGGLVEGRALVVQDGAKRTFLDAPQGHVLDVVAHMLVDQVHVVAQRAGQFGDGRRRGRRGVARHALGRRACLRRTGLHAGVEVGRDGVRADGGFGVFGRNRRHLHAVDAGHLRRRLGRLGAAGLRGLHGSAHGGCVALEGDHALGMRLRAGQ